MALSTSRDGLQRLQFSLLGVALAPGCVTQLLLAAFMCQCWLQPQSAIGDHCPPVSCPAATACCWQCSFVFPEIKKHWFPPTDQFSFSSKLLVNPKLDVPQMGALGRGAAGIPVCQLGNPKPKGRKPWEGAELPSTEQCRANSTCSLPRAGLNRAVEHICTIHTCISDMRLSKVI